MDKAVIYARFSSSNQREQSIEQQVRICEDYAKRNGFSVVAVYADNAISGRTDSRPEFQKMIKESEKNGFQTVIVYALDRFSRNKYDHAVYSHKLKTNGVRIVSATEPISDDPAGILMESLLVGLSEYYSAELSAKIRRGYDDNARNCILSGKRTIPLGYQRGSDGRAELVPAEAQIVTEIFQRVASGEMLIRIAEDLNERGIRTKNGGVWNRSSFNRILSNERYKGIFISGDYRIPDGMPRIIDDGLFSQVQTILAKKPNARHSDRRRTPNGFYLLTGRLYCGQCGERMVGISGTRTDGDLSYYYACKNHRLGSCNCQNIQRDRIESLIAGGLHDIVLSDDCIKWIAETSLKLAEKDDPESERRIIEDELRAVRKRKSNVLNAICEGIITESTKQLLTDAEQEETVLSDRLAYLEDQHKNRITEDDIVSYLEAFRSGSVDDKSVQQGIIDAFVLRAEKFPDKVRVYFSIKKENREIDLSLDSDCESYNIRKWSRAESIRFGSGWFAVDLVA